MTKLANAFFEFKEGDFKPRVVFFQHPGEEIVPAGMLPSGKAPEDGLFDVEETLRFLVERVQELEAENADLQNQLRDALERC